MRITSNSRAKIKSFVKPQAEIETKNYLEHPMFGLLTKVGQLEENLELFTTLYVHRIFFLVSNYTTGINFEPINRTNACLLVENRIKRLHRAGQSQEKDKLFAMYQLSF